jgi:acetyl esterase/lipase
LCTSNINHVDGNSAEYRRFIDDENSNITPTSTPSPSMDQNEEKIRQRLQMDHRPIIVFVCGGAWMIGYKMWGALLARVLTHTGMTVILPDYRNYPFWGTIPNQVQDIDMVLQWIFSRIDPTTSPSSTTTPPSTTTTANEILDNVPVYPASDVTIPATTRRRRKVILVGQSAGGHLVMTLVLRKVLNLDIISSTPESLPAANTVTDVPNTPPPRTTTTNNDNSSTRQPYLVSDLTGVIVLSAPLDVQNVYSSTFRKHGLSESFMKSMFFPSNRNEYDPLQLLQQIIQQQQQQQLSGAENNSLRTELVPPIKVYHGNCDRTVPYEGSIRFVELFQQQLSTTTSLEEEENSSGGISFHMYEGWSHTDPILEGPMDADHRFHYDIVTTVQDWIRKADNNDNADVNRFTNPNSNNNNYNIHWPGDEEATSLPVMKRLCPHFLIQMGRFCMPF